MTGRCRSRDYVIGTDGRDPVRRYKGGHRERTDPLDVLRLLEYRAAAQCTVTRAIQMFWDIVLVALVASSSIGCARTMTLDPLLNRGRSRAYSNPTDAYCTRNQKHHDPIASRASATARCWASVLAARSGAARSTPQVLDLTPTKDVLRIWIRRIARPTSRASASRSR